MQGRHSTINDERKAKLDGLGFIWDSHRAAWEDKYTSICDFRVEHGHCSVPSKYQDKNLAIWVKVSRVHVVTSRIL